MVHGFWHSIEVLINLKSYRSYAGGLETCIAALLHDIEDRKVDDKPGQLTTFLELIKDFIARENIPVNLDILKVKYICGCVSVFKNGFELSGDKDVCAV